MSDKPTELRPPIVLQHDGKAGLYFHYDELAAGRLGKCLKADKVPFSRNPPEAAHLAQPGKASFVFGRLHPRTVAEWVEMVGEEVVIDPAVVITEDLYHPPVRQLLSLGKAAFEEENDYVALGLSPNDVPALIQMAADYQLHSGPEGSLVIWAPIHAWRALGQLRAVEAIGSLVELFPRVDDWDEWVSDDLPRVLARFGAAAFEPACAFLADTTRGEWARTAAAKTLGHIGRVHSELRLEAIHRLSAQLERFAEQPETLNAMVVSQLWDLKAVEAMPVIERAFASGCVDESVVGDLEDVQIHFGLKTQREHHRKPNRLSELGDKIRAQWQAAGFALPNADGFFPEPPPDEPLPMPEAEPKIIADSTVPYIAPPKVGRNDPCLCGSGKKFKKCCGK